MAKARAIIRRRKTVSNIKKITRTMQLIATAKFQRCLRRATASRPYTDKITELVTQLSSQMRQVRHPLLSAHHTGQPRAVLVITSNRGLCGGFHAQILRSAIEHIKQTEQDAPLELHVAGKKGTAYFRFLGRQLQHSYTHFDDRVRYEEVAVLANDFIDRFSRRQLDSVHVAYMKFLSTAKQTPTVLQLLPIQPDAAAGEQTPDQGREIQYEFSPTPETLLAELLPESVRIRLFQCFIDHAVSEQIARMVAMKAATDAGGEMIKILTRRYNRARQTQITMELLDIMGGAEALRS